MSFLSGCHVGRVISLHSADVNDHKRFPAYTIKKSDQPFHFSTGRKETIPIVPDYPGNNGKYSDFDHFLEDHHTRAFLVIRNDSILYERYFDGMSAGDRMPSFSVAKSFVSALTGIAVDEGYISSVSDPITNYLNGFKHGGVENVTIKNLLNMRSGLRFSETYYNPFGHAARFYYGNNLKKYVYRLGMNEKPGEKYYYNSANTVILAMIIEESTGKKFTEYFEEKIWTKMGTEYDASWNYDSEKHGMVKAFCCLNAAPRDFAKFGRLYLNHGMYDGKEVIPSEWVDYTMNIHNDSRDSENYPYTYYWRVLENGNAFAKGILGQYIYLVPSKNLIIIRMGKKQGKISWSKLFGEIAGQY
ncbi:MAG: serine hydrolase [Bacteroidales bacterium]|nr:serine hydrolase [Bacteroidales bacterium]